MLVLRLALGFGGAGSKFVCALYPYLRCPLCCHHVIIFFNNVYDFL